MNRVPTMLKSTFYYNVQEAHKFNVPGRSSWVAQARYKLFKTTPMNTIHHLVRSDIPEVKNVGLWLIEQTQRIANIADPHLSACYPQDTMHIKRGVGRILLEVVDLFRDELLHRFRETF